MTTNLDINAASVDDDLQLNWFGVGHWKAPFWFLGPEPGGDHVAEWPVIWRDKFDSAELVDCKQHCLAAGGEKWYLGSIPTQPYWRGLIRTVLSYRDKPYDLESVRKYQSSEFGSTNGDIASLELSANSARNMSVEVDRHNFRAERIKTLQARLNTYRPAFLICCGTTLRPEFEDVVGPIGANGFSQIENTIVALVRHPSREQRPEYWGQLGRTLRQRRLSLGLSDEV
jgi:hypothetical protein